MSRYYNDPTTGNLIPTAGYHIDTENNTTTFASSDVATDADATAWTDVTKIDTGETQKSLFAKISKMFKNIRFLKNEVNDLNSALPKLLWTNSEYNGSGNLTAVAAGKISIDTTKYEAFILETCDYARNMFMSHKFFKPNKTNGTVPISQVAAVNAAGYWVNVYSRTLTVENDGISYTTSTNGHVDNGSASSGVAQGGSYIIPIRLFGIEKAWN